MVVRWAVLFLVLLVVGGLLWPSLQKLGLARLPGDTVLLWQGYRFHLPVATALLISAVVAFVWRLLDR